METSKFFSASSKIGLLHVPETGWETKHPNPEDNSTVNITVTGRHR